MLKDFQEKIDRSNLISRDLSWLQFNYRVLDQAKKQHRNVIEKLKFLAITSSNADEFFMIRVGSLYNYLDYGKERMDYSGLKEVPFKEVLLGQLKVFANDQNDLFIQLRSEFKKHHFDILTYEKLDRYQKELADHYFDRRVFPMLTPMVFDQYHSFPVLTNKMLILGVATKTPGTKERRKMSFIQIPSNLPRFFEIEDFDGNLTFVPVESIIAKHLDKVFKFVDILSCSIFRVTRNGDFTLEESEDIDANFLEELQKKLKKRKTGRVVRLEILEGYDSTTFRQLKKRFDVGDENIKVIPNEGLLDYSNLWQIVGHTSMKQFQQKLSDPVPPISMSDVEHQDMFRVLSEKDVLMHHPYNTIEPLLDLLEQAAEDPEVLSIKLTIYRLAKESRVVEALLRAAENGVHVSVLFEVKARFDEENNMKQAKRLEKAGCFVVYGISHLKTHTKLLLIVKKEGDDIKRFVHMSSGNYNESTARLYTDIGLMSSNDEYANDVQEFFNVITGHSLPVDYDSLITAPVQMRSKFLELIANEHKNALAGLPCGIVIKINSLQDKDVILAMYDASRAGVPIKLIVRGICSLRPGRSDMSDNITVRSIVGEYLEHSRIFYFHNAGDPKVYCGSADMMVRSFDRRLESLFIVKDEVLKQQTINILSYNLRDNVNAYEMNEDGSYTAVQRGRSKAFNIHKEFYKVDKNKMMKVKLF